MKMIKVVAVAAIGVLASGAALACDPAEAEKKWLEGEEAGITLGFGTVQDAPSFAVHLPTWQQLDYSTRVGLVETFECAIAGPDGVLRKAHVITQGGKILAVWDGVSRELEIR